MALDVLLSTFAKQLLPAELVQTYLHLAHNSFIDNLYSIFIKSNAGLYVVSIYNIVQVVYSTMTLANEWSFNIMST